MYTKNASALVILAVGFVLFSSCGLGLSPSVNEDQTSVSLRLASLGTNAAGNPSRAVMPGANYLYIRTIGIEGKTSGALYGPYTVSTGSDFVTDDIPAGEYDRIYVVCSGKDLESEARTFSFFGGTYTFHELMSLPDSQMVSFASSDVDKTALDESFDGEVTFGEKDGVTLIQGKKNSLSLTLAPITSAGYTLNVGASRTHAFSSTARSQHFYRLEGIKVVMPVTSGGLSFTISATSASAGTLSAIAFFSSTGAQISVTKSGTDLVSGQTWTIDSATLNSIANPDGTVELYQYLDYTGDLSASYANSAGGVLVSFDGDAASDYTGKKLIFKIYDGAAADKVSVGASWSQVTPVSAGIIDLDATSGDGSIQVPVKLVAGATYYLSALVSSTGDYAGLTSLTGVDLQTIVPYRNDRTIKSETALVNANIPYCITVTGGDSIALTASQFETYDQYVIFVSDTGSSDGPGATPSEPATLRYAINKANEYYPSTTMIYVTSDISGFTMNNDFFVAANIVIRSYGSNPFVIRPTTSDVKTISPSESILYVTSGRLSCQDLVLDASQLVDSGSSLCFIGGGELDLDSNTTLKGTGVEGNIATRGGGVFVAAGGARLLMMNATIMNCNATYGGAIYLESGSPSEIAIADLMGNSILDGNIAGFGSALYIGPSSRAECGAGTIVRNNHASSGGGTVCHEGSDSFIDHGIIFTNNENHEILQF